MKALLKIMLVFLPFTGALAAMQDTIYVMRSGMVVYKKAISEIDSISFGNSFVNRKNILEKIANDPGYSIFYQGLVATGLVDSLKADRDRSYDPAGYKSLITAPMEANLWYYQALPGLRRYGYTLIMESDSVFRANGISNLAELKTYAASVYNAVYPEDASVTNVKNRKNSLNRFIAYHIINKKLKLNMFIDAYDTDHMLKNVDMYEYLEPMCPNSLIEIKKERATNRTNLFNQSTETGNAIRIIKTHNDADIYNGYYYGIDKVMCYDLNLHNNLSSKRLRFNIGGLFPELANNNIRGSRFEQNTTPALYNQPSVHYMIPPNYFERSKTSEHTMVAYLCGYPKFQNYQGDELAFMSNPGKPYKFSVVTPTVPAGTYEVRLGYLTNGKRGIVQIMMDSIYTCTPNNFNLMSGDPSIGYETPGTNPADPEGFENDKAMRNHGYMKAPACFRVPSPGWTSGQNARFSPANLRKILGTYTFNIAGSHTITVSGLISGEFMIDYIEFMPVSALQTEDIY